MRIAEAARRSGVNPETIRYYERIALIPAPMRTASGYRDYRSDDVQRLITIRRARELGFSVAEVRDLLALADRPDEPCDEVTVIARGHLRTIREKLTRLHALQEELERIVATCPGASTHACSILAALADDLG
jgi:MerR family mercuric resistance operon transcriptional regulator